MWFGKSIMTKLGLALALAVPSFAADLKPFNFAGVASTSQQDYWEELMKYKVFGEQGIFFIGQNIRVTDTVGWFGTAKGPFDMSNGNGHHVVGGPIIIGGDLKLSNGNDSLFTGPVRVNGNVRLGYDTWSDPNFVRGDQCIGGAVTLDRNGNTLVTYDANHNRVDIYDTAVKMGSLYKGSNYNSCPKSVPKYYEDLTIPHPNSVAHTEHAAISIDNKIAYIDVPKGTGQYDYYVKGLSFANQSVLVVRMPKGGRLTRVFVNGNINFGTAHPKVRIVYMDDDVEWVGDDDTGHWNANGGYDGDKDVELEHNGKTEKVSTSVWHVDHSTNVENKDYVGNLLVYSTGKISWGAVTAADSMIGSYIAADSITIEQHMTLAGQLLGKYVRINADFDGSFQFMPYDNPKVTLPKAADDSEYLIEGIPNTIKIQLDKASKLPIDFKYCFEFEGAENDLTSGLASRADIEDSDIPLYNSSTKTCSTSKPGRFEAGETSMRNPITLTALKDIYTPEGKGTDRLETFKIWITGLTGATLEDGSSHDGFIVLTIKDVGGPQFNDDVKNYYVEENKKKGFVFDSIPIKNVKVDVADADKFTLEITGSDATLAKTLFDFELVKEARNDPDVYDTAYIKMSVKTDDLNYEALSQTSFELKFRLKNDGTATDSTVRTINVIDINEAPKITSIEDLNQDYSGSPTPYILYPKETLEGGDSVGVVWVDDPDTKSKGKFTHQEYSIDDASVPFTMSHDTIVVKNGEKLNHEDGIDYTFEVKVTNCEWNVATNSEIPGGVCHVVKQEITVKVQDVNEPPVILCKDNSDPKCKGPYDVFEHSKKDSVIYTFIVKDEDKVESFTTTVTDKNGTEIKLFSAEVVKNTTTGDWELPLVVAEDIDYETMDHSYDITITVTDKGGETNSIKRTINIVDVNETPTITGVEDLNDKIKESDKDPFTFYPREDLEAGGSVGYVHTFDPDVLHKKEFGYLTFSIDDPTVPFEMKDSLMVLKQKLNFETDDVEYTFDVIVNNCEREKNSSGKYVVTDRCLAPVKQTVTVKLQDVDEPPVLDCFDDDVECLSGDPFKIAEHSAVDTYIAKFKVTDVDDGDAAKMTVANDFELIDVNNTGVNDLFKLTYSYNTTTKVGTLQLVVKDDVALDYEKIPELHDFKIVVKDPDNDLLTAEIARKVKVIDINEAPVIAGVLDPKGNLVTTLTPNENLPKGTKIGSISATDIDTKHPKEFGVIEYFIEDPSDEIPFIMDGSSILVEDSAAMNFELAKHDYEFDVLVQNCEWEKNSSGKYTKVNPPKCIDQYQTVKVSIQDVEEPPIIIPDCKGTECTVCSGPDCHDIVDSLCEGPNCTGVHTHDSVLTLAVKENVPTGYKIVNYLVSDEDVGAGHKDTLVASFKNTNKSGADSLFVPEMKRVNGEWRLIISVKDSSKFNYEKIKESHALTIYVKDLDDPTDMGDSIRRIIRVVDVNEAPVLGGKDTTIVIKENLDSGKVAGVIPASDPDTKHVKEFGHLEFSILDKNMPFTMDSNKVVVTNPDTLNYEVLKPDTTFIFRVQVANCELTSSGKYDGACLFDTALVTIAVTDEPEETTIIPDCKGDECTVCTGPDCHDIMDSLCKGPNCTGVHTHDSVLTLAVKENVPTGYKIINYLVSDEDVGTGHQDTLIASFKNTNKSGADSLFAIDMQKVDGKWRVVVSVKDSSKLDYEKVKATHKITIYVSDPDDPAGMGDSIRRIIEVVDVNEAPKAEDADLKPEENQPKGTVIGKLKVTEPDTKHVKEFGHLEYSIIGKDDTFAFVMDSNKVVVNDPTKMDYELAVHKYTFDVLISNCELNSTSGKYDGACLYDTATVTVDIQDVNEVPTIIVDGPTPDGDDDSDTLCVAYCDTTGRGVSKDSILTIGVRENTEDGRIYSETGKVLFVYHVVDEDTGHVAGAKVEWTQVSSTISSVSTKGSDLFKLDYKNGVITVTVKDEKLLDYETLRDAQTRDDPDPEYTMAIIVTDPKGLSDTLLRVIRIIDENEKPLYTAEPCVVVEGNHPGDSIGHVEHPSDIDSLSRNPALYDNQFKMTGGDLDRFELRKDSTDLMRVMLAALDSIDCENGTYICGVDSVYWVELTYGDTTLKTVYNNVRIPVKVLDLNEPPEFRTDTIGVAENSPKGTDVGIIEWFDWDSFDTTMHFEITKDPSGCFAINENTGAVTVKKNKCAALDYEKNPTLDIEVAITDLDGVTDRRLISGGPNTVKKTIRVNVHDVNEPPSLTDKTITVKEDTKPKTVVDTVRATDPDIVPEYTDLTYTLIGGDTATFKIEPKTGALILKDTLDYEAKSSYYVTVRVDDGEFADTAKVKINIGNVKEWTKVKITEASTKRKTWDDPDVIYTYEPIREICWNQDGFDTCMTDLNIAKDTVVVVSWKNPVKDYAGRDSVRIYFNNAVPAVSIKADTTLVTADNVFTIVEDMGEADTNIYLNKPKDSIFVVIKDPASKLDTTFKIEVGLEPIEPSKVQSTLDKMTKIVDSKIMRDETAKNVVETAINDNQYKYSYNEIVGKDTVKVSYMTDKDGDPIKVPVVNEKGKIDSVEVITVTYKTVINGKQVEVSYQADALTGQVYVKGPAGELMEQGASKKLYGKGKDPNSTKATYDVNEGMFTITTGGKDVLGNDRVISYSVDKKGNMVKNTEGDAGYSVTYSFVNKYGNVATESVFIVVDQVGPVVEILSPINKEVIRSNSVKVVWTVDGIEQDTLTLQGLSKGPNVIVRFYRDKAGNEASDTVYVFMKDSKDVDISVEQPVTEISADKIEEYYAVNPPEKGETFAVSIKNPTTGEEVETLIGGSFKTKEGSGKEPYPGVSGSNHLGPTLAMDIKVPIATAVGGLATLDDIVTSGNMISLKGVDAKESPKITVEQYVEEYCEKDFELPSDLSKVNLYDTKLHAQIWVYTSLGNFVDYFNFTQDLNDPSYTDDAGLLKMYFEMKPDKDGFVKADNGKQYATGAFVYKVQANIRSKARCTIPDQTYGEPGSLADGFSEATKRKGDVIKNSDELLKSFGYRRPQKK